MSKKATVKIMGHKMGGFATNETMGFHPNTTKLAQFIRFALIQAQDEARMHKQIEAFKARQAASK